MVGSQQPFVQANDWGIPRALRNSVDPLLLCDGLSALNRAFNMAPDGGAAVIVDPGCGS